jgi:Reverse transcriptase (RNA-dependent DNA polymerase)
MWVFTYKYDDEGYLVKYKARLCARGDQWQTNEDTYAATLALQTFRAILAIAATWDLEIKQYDAINAYVNSDLPTLIACRYPKGVGLKDRSKIAIIRRALYGLPISGLL